VPPPNDSRFEPDIFASRPPDGPVEPSHGLIDLLVRARQEYRWPFNASAYDSQVAIVELEAIVRDRLLTDLTPQNALGIICDVSAWGNNNVRAQRAIENANDQTKQRMADAIALMSNDVCRALDRLTFRGWDLSWPPRHTGSVMPPFPQRSTGMHLISLTPWTCGSRTVQFARPPAFCGDGRTGGTPPVGWQRFRRAVLPKIATSI